MKWVAEGPLLTGLTISVCVTALVLCQTPLFNLLGFEFAFAIGIPLSLFAGFAGIWRTRINQGQLWYAWFESLTRSFCLALVALILITLNALRITNCNYLEGLAHFAIIPCVGIITASGWGVVVGHFFREKAGGIFLALWLSSILRCFLQFWFHPQIDLFNVFLGYFPGAIYDEVLLIDDRMVASRLEDLCGTIVAVVLGAWHQSAWLRTKRTVLLLVLTLVSAITVNGWASSLGVHRDEAFIRDALGGHAQSEHFVIYHPNAWSSDKVERMTTELEFLYSELSAFFKTDTRKRITAFLYPDAATKKRLMGARRTRIAKPWQWSFHVDNPHIGQNVILHEMAHAFSGEFATSPHYLSLTPYGLPNMALIEGLAEAATWPSRGLDLHQWSAALQKIDAAPRVDTLLNPTRFYAQPSGMVYTLCGSFMRHIAETEGLNAMTEAYRDGYFRDQSAFKRMHASWLTRLNTMPLPENALAQAKARFDRPAIFGKTCAHEIAALRREMADATGAGRYDEALARNDKILSFLPDDLRSRLQRIALLYYLDKVADAETIATSVANDSRAGAVARTQAREWVADLAAIQGKTDVAFKAYEALSPQIFSRAGQRRIAVKKSAMKLSHGAKDVIEYLRKPQTYDQRLRALERLNTTEKQWSLLPYLKARVQLAGTDFTAGVMGLQQWQTWQKWPSITLEARRLLAQHAFDRRCYSAAATYFSDLANDSALNSSERFAISRWSKRALFFAKRRGDIADCQLYIDNRPRASEDLAQPGNEKSSTTVETQTALPIGGDEP